MRNTSVLHVHTFSRAMGELPEAPVAGQGAAILERPRHPLHLQRHQQAFGLVPNLLGVGLLGAQLTPTHGVRSYKEVRQAYLQAALSQWRRWHCR